MFKLVVLLSSLAFAAAKPGLVAPGYFAPGYFGTGYYGTPLAYSPLAAPLSLAPGQPAGILGADGRPLDTLDVNLAKAQHYSAKAYDGTGVHFLKKRSVGALPLAPLAYPAPLAYSAPLTYHTPLSYHAPLAYHGYAPSTIVHAW